MGFLGRAREFIKGLGDPPESRVQYFSVVCPLGHRVRGQRTEGYQAIRCPACGEGVFVLPSSPLPEPIAPVRSVSSRPAAMGRELAPEGPIELRDPAEVTVELDQPDDRSAEAEIIWDDAAEGGASAIEAGNQTVQPQPAGPGGGSPSARTRPRHGSQVTPDASPAKPVQVRSGEAVPAKTRPIPEVIQRSRAVAPPAAAVTSVQAEPAGKREGARSRRGSRPLLVFVAVAVLVLATVAFRSWQHRRQEFPQIAAIGKNEGIPALLEGKFDKAHQLLSAAREAVDSLGGQVEDAEEIRHAAAEAALFVDLCPETLESMLDEAGRLSRQAWATRFQEIYKGRAVILDGRLVAAPGEGQSKRYELDYLVLPPGEGANFREQGVARTQRFARIDLTNFKAITQAQPRVGEHLTFGARLASFHYDTDAEEWIIGLDPDSGVSITYTQALETLGWPTNSGGEDAP